LGTCIFILGTGYDWVWGCDFVQELNSPRPRPCPTPLLSAFSPPFFGGGVGFTIKGLGMLGVQEMKIKGEGKAQGFGCNSRFRISHIGLSIWGSG